MRRLDRRSSIDRPVRYPSSSRKDVESFLKNLYVRVSGATSLPVLTVVDLQALAALVSLLTSGSAGSTMRMTTPAFVPAPQYLALAATMAVHPSVTTRTHRPEKIRASVEALQYVKLVLALTGPDRARFDLAYRFPGNVRSNRRGGHSRRRSESPEQSSHDSISHPMAKSSPLWGQATDFWAVVGWAFNCSICCRKRWDIWSPWLQHVFDVLDMNWKSYIAGGNADECLILKYLSGAQSRRVLRAILADGSKSSLQEFDEIWKNEAGEARPKGKRTYEKVTLDFENDEYGAYFDESEGASEDDPLHPQGEQSLVEQNDADSEDNFIDTIGDQIIVDDTAPLGGTRSLSLRMRLFALLLEVSLSEPERICDAESLVGIFNSTIRRYSLRLFASVMSVTNLEFFSRPAAAFLVQSLACTFLESAAPRTNLEDLTQAVLIENYLPWAANTSSPGDNAKLAACDELLLRIYDKTAGLIWSTNLDLAAQTGCKRRVERIQKDLRKKSDGTGSGLDEQDWLRGCEQRMTLLLQLAYKRADRAQQSDLPQTATIKSGHQHNRHTSTQS